jgi:hypothetical protein
MTEAQCAALRGKLDVYRQATKDALSLVSAGILTAKEARQMLGIDPPDDVAKVQVTINTYPADTNRYTLHAVHHDGRNTVFTTPKL